MGFIGIIVGFAFLLFGVWKKYNLIGVTLGTSAIIALTNGLTVIEAWQTYWVAGISGFAAPFFILFCFGALFGKLMEDSGATYQIGKTMLKIFGQKYAVFSIIVAAVLLTYGGVSVFVSAFVLLPLSKVIFEKGNIPWYLLPAVLYGAMLPVVGVAPGALQVHNMVPTKYLGTTLTSAPVLGILMTIFYYILLVAYVIWAIKKGRANTSAPDFNVHTEIAITEVEDESNLPCFTVSLIPIIVALVLINVVKIDMVYGLIIACSTCMVLFYKKFDNIIKTFNTGLSNGIMPTILVAATVGVARVVTATPAFVEFKDWLIDVPVSGIMKLFLVSNSVAFITGSATGSISTTLDIFGEYFLNAGFDPGVIHRMVIASAVGFDSMPWNSFVVLLMAMSGLSYKTSYKHIFVTSVVFTILTALLGVVLTGFGIV